MELIGAKLPMALALVILIKNFKKISQLSTEHLSINFIQENNKLNKKFTYGGTIGK